MDEVEIALARHNYQQQILDSLAGSLSAQELVGVRKWLAARYLIAVNQEDTATTKLGAGVAKASRCLFQDYLHDPLCP